MINLFFLLALWVAMGTLVALDLEEEDLRSPIIGNRFRVFMALPAILVFGLYHSFQGNSFAWGDCLSDLWKFIVLGQKVSA